MKRYILLFTTEMRGIFQRHKFLSQNESDFSVKTKWSVQIAISIFFFILSITNFLVHSYTMVFYTSLGCVINGLSAYISRKFSIKSLCSISSICSCSVLFLLFLTHGANDGFGGLWLVLIPFSCMMIMDFFIGLIANIILQIVLIAMLWTPSSSLVAYPYNDQFCLRFPLLFFVSFMLGLVLTVLLQKSQYDAFQHALKLEKMTEKANHLAKYDFLTELPNRRYAYEDTLTKNFRKKCRLISHIV